MPDSRRGVLFGAAAYTMWGLFPLYWPLLRPTGAVEILAHRIAWSLVVVLGVLLVRRHWSWIRTIVRRPRTLLLLTLAAMAVTVNWGLYIYAVNSGHVVESSLGYFINPLVNVLFGVLVFRERMRRWQWVAVGLGALAVVVLSVDYGRPPWIALVLAASFGTYGLLKKSAGVGAAESLAVETLVLLGPALGYLLVLEFQGAGTFAGYGVWHAVLLAGAGLVTAVPLMMFTAAAIRVPLTVLGLLQYIAPILQFLCGVLVAREVMPMSRWVGFAVIWAALAVFSWDSLRHTRAARRRAARPAEPVAPLGRVPQPERSAT
ncbi:EamA family transporter RarD [Sphaerisporangium sp. B11E5]|uniref:EamA family transporter RarD n=1 Tax=Sphaerisporangium sp. B11E5 TaxID=3153563 RepID=UPI00325D087A